MKVAYSAMVAVVIFGSTVTVALAQLTPAAHIDPNTVAPQASLARHAIAPGATPDDPAVKPFTFPSMPSAFVTLRPTTTTDVFDPADITSPGTGRLSLREAFALANKLNIETAILLERGAVYRLERCGRFDTAPDESNELVHTANKTLTVNGNAATVFQDCDGAGVIVQQGGNQLLNLVDLTIVGGRSTHTPGGGVWSSGTGEVRVTNAVVIDNQVSHIDPQGDHETRVYAGGVASNGDVTISGSTFAHNMSSVGAGAVAALGSVKALKSTFYANSGLAAGAIVAGKSIALGSSANGPPPFTGRTPDGVTLVYATLTGNSRPQLRVTDGVLTSFATIIASPGSGVLCELTRAKSDSLGANYASGGSGCGFGTGPRDRANGPDPRVRAIRGMKQTDVYAPEADSPLTDAIAREMCMPPAVRALLPVYTGSTSDELGVPRPQGSGCDIGAIEAIHAGSLVRNIGVPPISDLPVPTRWAPAQLGLSTWPGEIRVTTVEDVFGQSGSTSLRDAVASANHSAAAVTIVLEPHKIYRLTRCVAPQAAIDNETNDLVYVGHAPLQIEGSGSSIIQTCDGSGVLAIFADSRVTLSDVTIAGGRSVIHPGGGLYLASAGTLRLERAWVTDNSSVAAGGGIASFGNVELFDSTISANHSMEVGGGVIGTADVTAVNSSIFDNTADLAIGAIGNHSGKLTLLFSTITHNSAPNVAVGSIAAFGSIIADYLPPSPPPGGFPVPAPAGAHDGPPPDPTAAPPSAGAPPPGPGGFPPPANCGVEHPGVLLEGNYSTDSSCGFATVGPDPRLTPNHQPAPTYLIPQPNSPVAHLVPSAACAAYRGSLDQSGNSRSDAGGCTSGSIERATASSGSSGSGTNKRRDTPHTPRQLSTPRP